MLALRFGPVAHGVGGVTVTLASVGLPYLAGTRWPVPATLYAALLTGAFLHADGQKAVRPQDVGALLAAYALTFGLVEWAAPSVALPADPPQARPSTSATHQPQLAMRWWSTPSKLMAPLNAVPCGRGCTYDAEGDFLKLFYASPVSPTCPKEFVGVWWMCGNTFPMQLTSVHHARWRVRDPETNQSETTMWLRSHTTRSATLSGFLLWLGQSLCITKVVVLSRWIRTDGSFLPMLHLFPDTYWIYRHSDDELWRLVYNRKGRVVWQYRMLRIARGGPSERTRHFDDFVKAHRDEGFWYG